MLALSEGTYLGANLIDVLAKPICHKLIRHRGVLAVPPRAR
jgi:hypothetical protein